MNNKFYNLLNYYKSTSITKKLVDQSILTIEESTQIIEELKKYYKISEMIDENHISAI